MTPKQSTESKGREEAIDQLLDAAADVVLWAEKIEGPASHARCLVKRKYMDRLHEALKAEALAAFRATREGSK